jgi:hypothetical protein
VTVGWKKGITVRRVPQLFSVAQAFLKALFFAIFTFAG